MKIYETLQRDPRTSTLANNGQARITGTTDERAIQELKAELETFVCDGQYGFALERILQNYLTQLDRPRQDAAWVSGFYGSGKSHLLKVISHLWVDTPFADGSTARSLVHALPKDVAAHLQELDGRVRKIGKTAVAAAGTLPAGSGDHVRLTVLSIILRATGFPERYPQAQFCLWLRENGKLETVRKAVEDVGKDWFSELDNLYVSGLLAREILRIDPDFAGDERQARQVLRDRFPLPSGDISTADFIQTARAALSTDGDLPPTILVLDEVQQYIGDSTDRAVTVTELAEAVQTQLDSRVMLVASGQSALAGTPLLQRLRDRFRITIQLSDTDVEAVTRKVLLHKKASATESVQATLDRYAGEVSKHLQGTRLGERPEDRQSAMMDYPLLPTRRRFWEECFRVVDAAGTQSQLRSQLRIIHDALGQIAEQELGAVIPGDSLYGAIAPDLVNTGVLLNEIAARIQELDDGSASGALQQRICGLVFLINKLPRDAAIDVGVRANARTVADLLVDDVSQDSGPFRKQVEEALEALAESSALMKVDDEYRLQTAEGAEWDRAYREKLAALRQNEPDIAVKRDQLLSAAVQKTVSEIRLQHGESKLRRTLTLHVGLDEPPASSDHVIVWLRDGWSSAQKDVEGEARRRGQTDPFIHVFLPRKAADDLRSRIVEAEAARQVLDLRGIPTTPEGREARDGMLSRQTAAIDSRDELVREIVTVARVFQGGGSEVYGDSLRHKLEAAAVASLARLFPEFGDADHRAWETALKRARQGSDEPLQVVGWDKATEDHPVARTVLATIGNGERGGDIRKKLKASPYGWPQDAIDAALIALHRSGSIRATLNGRQVAGGQLDQNRIQTTDFRLEKVRLGTGDKLALRGLYQKAGVAVKAGEEESKAPAFLEELIRLAGSAGGDAPLPPVPSTRKVEDLKKLAGSEQLGAILDAREELEGWIDEWKDLSLRIDDRRPGWERLEKLLVHAASLPVVREVHAEVESIRESRSLLDQADHITPLLKKVSSALRSEVKQLTDQLHEAITRGMESLERDTSWQAVDTEERDEVLKSAGLVQPAGPSPKSDDDLIRELQRHSLEARRASVAAVPERISQCLAMAARKSQPGARRIRLQAATLHDEDEVRDWVSGEQEKLLKAVAEGPVIVG